MSESMILILDARPPQRLMQEIEGIKASGVPVIVMLHDFSALEEELSLPAMMEETARSLRPRQPIHAGRYRLVPRYERPGGLENA